MGTYKKSKIKSLLITGVFRSGMSLLSTALNSHKNMAIGWQPYWLFFKACRNKFFREVIKKELDDNYPMGVLQFESAKEEELFRKFLFLVKFGNQDIKKITSEIKDYLNTSTDNFNRDMKPAYLSSHLDNITQGNAGDVLLQLMEAFYFSEIEKLGKKSKDIKIIGIKEIFCEEYINPILDYDNNNWLVLHVIRDPRAIVASRNYGKYMEAVGSKYPIFFIIRSWKRTVANYFLNRDKPNYLMVKYEDLVINPERIFYMICDKLGIPFSSDILNFKKYTDSKGRRWKPNSSFKSNDTINALSIDKWKKVLSSREIEVIEYFCQEELRKLGYEITTNNFCKDRVFDFYEDTSCINNWLGKYDFSYTRIKE